MKRILVPCLAGLLACFTGCVPSMVYNPAIHPSADPVRAGSVQVAAGWNRLPEARPEEVPNKTASGFDGVFRFGVTQAMSILLNLWLTGENVANTTRGGAAAGTMIMLKSDSADWSTAVSVRAGFAWGGASSISVAGGGAASFVVWLPRSGAFRPYLGIGPVIGFLHLFGDNGNPAEWGWGLIGNAGLNVSLTPHIWLDGELSPCLQNDVYDQKNSLLLSPSLTASVEF